MSSRPKPALYGDAIGRALRKYAAESGLRSEEHRRFREFFVDVGANYLQTLEGPDWQVIYGRRGTGKTHLLGYFEDEVVAAGSSCVVGVTAQRLRQRTVGRAVPLVDRARERFVSLLIETARAVTDIADARLDEIEAERHPASVARRGRITADLVDLLDLAESGEVLLDARNSHPPVVPTRVSGRRGADRSGVVGVAEAFGNLVIGVLEGLDIPRLYLCIDEWSTLDPSAGLVVQPEFGDLLKIAFKGTERVSVKIATNRFQTTFSNKGSSRSFRGLELGADIEEAINLDHVTLGHEELSDFYLKLIFKRLEALEPDLRAFRGASGRIDEQFVSSLFHDRRAFEQLVYGADAIPRNFLRTISKLYADRGYDPRDRWRAAQIAEELKTRGAEGGRSVGYRTQAHQLMTSAIRPVVTASGRREFLAQRTDADRLKRGFEELFEKRLIHEIPDGQLPSDARDTHQGFRLDYGVMLDWLDLGFDAAQPIRGRRETIEKAHWTALVIDVSSVELDHLECPFCKTEFSPEEHAFRARGLCPNCFEETDLTDPHAAPVSSADDL
jgi:hypothetical protein